MKLFDFFFIKFSNNSYSFKKIRCKLNGNKTRTQPKALRHNVQVRNQTKCLPKAKKNHLINYFLYLEPV